MIQELLGGSGLLGGGDRKFSFHGTILEGIPSSSSPSPSPSASTTTATNTHTTLTTTPPPLENLRCPRCDSPNTKFCYYNNYNLTQPRHFCKTCRRYWTKGGALRNVPIGGGCRKNKSTIVSAASGKSTAGKGKIVSSEFIKANVVNGLDIHEQSNNTVLWGSPQNSQLLSLLRGNPITNPNPNSSALSNFVQFKDEGHMIGSHVQSESAAVTGTVNARTLGLDPFGQSPIGLYTSLFRNNQHQPQQHQNQNLSAHGDGQNAGLQELYQRLRSSINYQPDHSFSTLTNVGTSMTTSSSSMMESVPATSGAEFGSWNPPFSWSDQSTTSNGAFP